MNTLHHFSDIFSLDAGGPLQLPVPSQSLIQRYVDSSEYIELQRMIQRGDVQPDEAIIKMQRIIERGVTSTMTAFPVRENLDAEVVVLSPVDTPLRNMLPRTPGSGLAVKWKQQTSFGASLGTMTTTSGNVNVANTLVVANARGFFVGEDFLYLGTTFRITAINYGTNVISVAAGIGLNSQVNGTTVLKVGYFWPEQGTAGAIFYKEDGAPTENTTVYADKTAAYKLLGDMGSVTMFSMAAGANFQAQYPIEKRNCLVRALLKEEYALLHSEDNVVAAPWGDGVTALGFKGMIPSIRATAPADHLQSSVGQLTVDHIHAQLARVWYKGGRRRYILMSGQEAISLAKIATTTGNYRAMLVIAEGGTTLGVQVTAIQAAVGGEMVPIYVHPFLPQGTMVVGSLLNVNGNAGAEVDVLPQALGDSPESAFLEGIQGFYAQDIAPTAAAPEVLKFKVAVYETYKHKNGQVFALSEGLTPA